MKKSSEVPGEHQIQKNDDDLGPVPADLADEVEGMYRLMDLVSESGSNGYGKEPFLFPPGHRHWFHTLIGVTVNKVIIAQDSLQRFINAISSGSYASITKVDFKILDRFAIKPLGIYGGKDEIVRLLRSIGAVDEKLCVLLVSTYLSCLDHHIGLAYCSPQAKLTVPSSHQVFTL